MQNNFAPRWLAWCLSNGFAARPSARLKHSASSDEVFLTSLEQPEAATSAAIARAMATAHSHPPPSKPEQPEPPQSNLLVADPLTHTGQRIYATLNSDEPRATDEVVENAGLNSSDVLATLFAVEMKGLVGLLPSELFSQSTREGSSRFAGQGARPV